MVYNSRSGEEDSARTRKREGERLERLASQAQKFAVKIAQFLNTVSGNDKASFVQNPIANTDIKKISLELQPEQLVIKHRGYIITTTCSDPAALSGEFRQWCRANMSHVTKIEPRAH